jgi:hypothetical protein
MVIAIKFKVIGLIVFEAIGKGERGRGKGEREMGNRQQATGNREK